MLISKDDSMKFTSCLFMFLIGLTATPSGLQAQDRTALSRSLAMHASFDKGLNADFSRGDKTLYSYATSAELAKGGVAGLPNQDIKLAPGAGRFGDALQFTKKSPIKPFFNGPKVLNYNDKDWSGTVSVWLRISPDTDLEPGYCDAVQLVGDDSKKGFVFLEWSKDEKPRIFRYAIRPLFNIWNPTNVQWADIPAEKRPAVDVKNAPFSNSRWTHVAFSFEHVNDKSKKQIGKFHIDGKLQGAIENWDLTFGWLAEKTKIVLGSAYVGYLDELAVFDRALTDDEVKMVHDLKGGIRDLY